MPNLMSIGDIIDPTRDTGTIVGQGGRSLEKSTCTDYDIIMMSQT